jgi:thioredoxin:protein disulfide reductase
LFPEVNVLAIALAAIVGIAVAEESPVRVALGDASAPAGGTARLPVRFEIPAGTHIYADMIAVEVLESGGLAVGELVEPAGSLEADPANPARQREVYAAGLTVVELPLTLPATASGTYDVRLLVKHQACRVGLCFPGAEEELVAHVSAAATPLVLPGIGTAAAEEPEEVPALFSAAKTENGIVGVSVDLQGDWHINKMFVTLTVTGPEGYAAGEPVFPPAVATGKEADFTYREDFVADFSVVAPLTGPEGPATVTVEFGYQACKGVSLCKMPTSEVLQVPVVGLPAGQVATLPDPASLIKAAPAGHGQEAVAAVPEAGTLAGAGDAEDLGGQGSFEAAAAQGGLWLAIFCFLSGVAVSFTPCVLPMVPITLGIIGAKSAGSRLEALGLSGAYVMGQAAVYTTLGLVVGLSGGMFGSWLQNQWVLGSIGGLFFVLGFSMFGFYDIQVPTFVQSRISGFDKRGGVLVAAVFGMIGALLAGPCSGPVVIGILGVVATGGQAWWGAVLMFLFALGMGMIFLVAGAAMGWMPKRGAYMVMVKKSFGIVMWLGAVYFARPLFSDTVTALLTAAVLLVTGVFAWPDPEDGEGFYAVRMRQLYTGVALLVGAYLLLGTLISGGFILPAVRLAGGGGSAQVATASGSVTFLTTEAEGIEAARAAGKPMMIDFTAEWCAACHEMEKLTYTDAGVVAAAEGFVPVMIDCTDKASPIVKAVQEKYAVRGLPTVVFALPDGTILDRTVGFVEASEFEKVMARAAKRARG